MRVPEPDSRQWRGTRRGGFREGAMARTTACSPWEAAVISAVVLTGFSKPAAAGQASAPQLAVGIQDEADVPVRILTAAQAEVARVFRRAGVETIWVATTTADLTIVIRSGKRVERTRLGPDTTGQAMVNAATRRGRLAYVFYSRIESRRLTTLTPAEFLGHIISHEIGHLLGIPHAMTGIMRAMWDPADLVLASEGLLLFRPDQAALLRHQVRLHLYGASTAIGATLCTDQSRPHLGDAREGDSARSGSSPSLSMSPTITTPTMTQAGLILGTAA